MGGPENRLHRFFEVNNLPFDNIEVLNIDLVRDKVRSTKLKIFNPLLIKLYGKTALFYLVNVVLLWIKIIKRLKKANVKIVLSTNPILSIPVVLLKKSLRISHIFDYVDDISELAKEYVPSIIATPISLIVKFIEEFVIKYSDKLIVSSKFLEHQIHLVAKKNPVYIPNGVDISLFSKNLSHEKLNFPIVGYIGGIYDWAGIEDFISTYPLVSKEIPEVKYHIYGTGDNHHKIAELAKQYEGVKFFGLIPYINVPKVLNTFTIGVIPFKKSILTDAACPLKLFEYWAAEVAVVSRNLFEVQKIARDSCLYFKTTNDLAKILTFTLLKVNLREKLIEYGLRRVLEYDWKNLAKKYYKVIKN